MIMIMTGVERTGGSIASLKLFARCSGLTTATNDPFAPTGIGRISAPFAASDGHPESFGGGAPDCRLHAGERAARVDHAAALGLPTGDLEESFTHAPMELDRHAFVTGSRVSASGRALEAVLDRQIENEGEVGLEIAKCEFVRGLARLPPETVAVALIGHRRIGETIAQHPLPARQCGRYLLPHVFVPGRGEKEEFAHRIPPARLAVHQERANYLGTGGAARLARGDDVACFAKRVRQQPELRALAGALPALERDEAATPAIHLAGPQRSWVKAAPMRPKKPSRSTDSPALTG